MANPAREPVPVVFLSGILMPAALRYRALLDALGDDVLPVVKDLEVYSGPAVPPPGYRLELELDGIERAADQAGFETFHLYGHSGGGACALAFTALWPDRVRSLAVDEPAVNFDAVDLTLLREKHVPMVGLPSDQLMDAFVGEMFRTGVEPPPRRRKGLRRRG